MKTKMFTLVSIATMLLTVNANAFVKAPHKTTPKKVHHSSYSLSLEEITKNLQFDFSKTAIHSAYYNQLDQLAKLLIEKNYAIALRGHADSIGTYVANWKMSEKRADKVKDYLVKKGVSEDHIVTTPFGSTIPVSTNKTPRGRQKNRRVEIRLSEINS
jgi:OOP family OmpA-OmpF porin